MFRTIIIFLTFGFCISLHSQPVLDQYVKEAIANNLSIREKKLTEQKERYSLQQAEKGYGPEVKFLTSYTLATGGRSIDLPIGTLLNDVYTTLNTLTGSSNFHQIENQSIRFLPDNFYDARLRITQPILQPEIKYNKLIQKEEVTLAELQTQQTIRELIRQVKITYMQWMQAQDAIRIIEQGLTLLKENKRITESLIKNGAGLPSALMRIESEITGVEAQRQKAYADVENASSYFNFLLNRPSNSLIEADSISALPQVDSSLTVIAREELQQIRSGNQIQDLALTIEEKHFAPRLGLQVDLGSQAYAPDWGGYVLGGVQLEIPIWDNHKSKLKRQEWEASISSTQSQLEWTKGALETELQAEIRNLESDLLIYNSYSASLSSNQRYYNETLRRYKEGLANYIELLDARSQVTNIALQQNIARYQAWIREINIERISAAAQIPQY